MSTVAMGDSTTRRGRRGHKGPIVQLLEGIHETSESPLYVRLYRHVRDAIVSGALPPGHLLPASRTLAEDLRVSRNTVESALQQLRAEGFVRRRVGAGTRVSPDLPLEPRTVTRSRAGTGTRRSPPIVREPVALSVRGQGTLAANHLIATTTGFTFAPCVPDALVLPSPAWRQIVARHGRHWAEAEMLPPDPAGHRPLREAIATYLVSSRGVRCDWRQVVVVASVQQGIGLLARLLLDPGDAVWLEEPGYPGARTAFSALGARVIPVPVDHDGLDVAAGTALAPRARMAYVTPSHQYPLGVTLSLARRMALLDWAERNDAWILEDDYDSEFRHVGRPLASIQGLDPAGRVIYAGTFNKVLYPSIRLAYLVLPAGLADAFASVHEMSGGVSSTFLQAVVAEFIDSGQFGIHLRRVRDAYGARRAVLLSAVKELLGKSLEPGPAETGLHLAGYFRHRRDDRAFSERAARHRLDVPALSRYYAGPPGRSGVLIHYAGTPEPMIRSGVETLASLLGQSIAGAPRSATRPRFRGGDGLGGSPPLSRG